MKIDPSAPAYPHTHATRDSKPGLTIRAEFAKAAMQGMVQGTGYWPDKIDGPEIARRSIVIADALIAELNKAAPEAPGEGKGEG